jgi:serine/threonine protein kinase
VRSEALQRLNHPNIVRVLELARERETEYIVMVYIAGSSLENVLQLPSWAALSLLTIT